MVNINSWLRQARYRARKHQVSNLLTTEQLDEVLSAHGNCAYCAGAQVDTLDNLIPFSLGGHNVQANTVPICTSCKSIKRNHDITWLFNNGHLSEPNFLSLVSLVLQRDGAELVKPALKQLLGLA